MKSRLLSILIAGFVLALGLLLAIQVTHSLRAGAGVTTADPLTSNEAFNETVDPVIFRAVSEIERVLRVTGTSEPNAVITIRNNAQNLRQFQANSDGDWTVSLNTENDPAMIIDVVAYTENGAQIRSDETLLRIPALKSIDVSTHDTQRKSLIMITAPGGPTRIIQSPFAGPLRDGPLFMSAIEYDDSGSAFFSGTSEVEGRVRIFVDEELIGQRPVSAHGRWFFIAVQSLKSGAYDIRAELSSNDGKEYKISVPFMRLKPQSSGEEDAQTLRVYYEPSLWQVSRSIHGGGRQNTAIFAPLAVAEDVE